MKRMSRMSRKHNVITQIATAGVMVCATAVACAADQPQAKTSPIHLDDPAPSFLHGLTLGLEAGTTGAGGRADWRFMDHFGVGTAFDYFTYSDSATIQGIKYNAEGPDIFLLGLRDVVEAQGGMGRAAQTSKLNRESLYRLLSQRGNPRLSSLSAVLSSLGLKVRFNHD
jgi:Probable addiction module antidote protein